MNLIQPKEITIEFEDEELKFNISKFPATVGREIIAKYPISNMPKIGDYKVSEETMLLLMKYVERVYPDRVQELTNKSLVDNHVPSWEVLAKLEMLMIDYNCSFFRNGKGLDFLKKLQTLAEPKIIEMLTVYRANCRKRQSNPKRTKNRI
jgi:hypothetical protein